MNTMTEQQSQQPEFVWPEQWPPLAELVEQGPYSRADLALGGYLIAQGGFDIPAETAMGLAWKEGNGTMSAYARRLLKLAGQRINARPEAPPARLGARGPHLADKECTACGAGPTFYYANPTSRDGLTSQCASCVKASSNRKQQASAILRDRHWQEYQQILSELTAKQAES